MNTTVDPIEREVSITDIDSSTLATLNKSEIDIQIATAKRYPRSIKAFHDDSMAMVTLNEEVADSCLYSLPRGGKTIEGASARFAEIIISAWGNSRAGARIVNETGTFVTAQGAFYDLQRNVAITYEVQRRITDKNGNRYKDDMVGVTANAACSIALRNAILKGVPKAFWSSLYEAARKTVMGDYQTLGNRRSQALKVFQSYGILPEQVYELLGVKGEEDITLNHLVTLRGTLNLLKEGETTPEMLFTKPGDRGHDKEKVKTPGRSKALREKLKAKKTEKAPEVRVEPGDRAQPGDRVDKDTGEIIEEEIVKPVGRQQKPGTEEAVPIKRHDPNFNQILTMIDDAKNELAVDDVLDLSRSVDDLTDTLRNEINDYGTRRKRTIAEEE